MWLFTEPPPPSPMLEITWEKQISEAVKLYNEAAQISQELKNIYRINRMQPKNVDDQRT